MKRVAVATVLLFLPAASLAGQYPGINGSACAEGINCIATKMDMTAVSADSPGASEASYFKHGKPSDESAKEWIDIMLKTKCDLDGTTAWFETSVPGRLARGAKCRDGSQVVVAVGDGFVIFSPVK